jgi:hypothetical protein
MGNRGTPAAAPMERSLERLFALLLLARLLYPFFNSPLDHLFSDPMRHWENGERFLHPAIMGSSDPYLYQLWIYGLRCVAQGMAPTVSLGCGILCAAMPYGWYRALRELQTRKRALAGALIIGLIPESIGLYAYFMNETLLLSLLGFCFWMTLRSNRKGTPSAYALAAVLWTCAAFTRTVALPMAAGCLVWLWATQNQKPSKALATAVILLVVAIPAGLHAEAKLGFFSPLGNLYFNEIYGVSGKREIEINYGPDGVYHFGSPSFYNPSFYPLSSWTTDRTGIVSVSIDPTQGRAAWMAEKQRVARERTFPAGRQRLEDLVYALFGQSWPNSDRSSLFGWLTVWTRWLWAPLIAVVATGLAGRRYRGAAYILPIAGLGTLALLLVQSEGVMEARYREPIDAILVCSALLMTSRRPSIQPEVTRLVA